MSKESHYLTKADYEKFDPTDTRYYGLFCSGKKDSLKIKFDPKRFQKSTCHEFSKEQLAVINARQTHYFYPHKNDYYDYHCNKFEAKIYEIREYWEKHFKPLIKYAKQKVKKPKELSIGDCDLLMCGILEPDEANMWANHENMMNTWRYNQECAMVVGSMYAQFIHHMASSIESVTVAVLTIEKLIDDHFDRNTLYGTAVNSGKSAKDLPSFDWYEKLYSLWNFIKHNSQSTYEKLEACYPQALIKGIEYKQGDLAAGIVDFSDDMIIQLIDGVSAFFKEYCELVFYEKFAEAQWNYSKYFMSIVREEIDLIENPLGLPDYI